LFLFVSRDYDQFNMTIVLYTYFRSSAAARVRIALELKNIKYECRFINLLNKENLTDEYSHMNPNKRIPLLVVNGQVLSQSVAILEFLEESFPEIPLLPKGTLERAKVRRIVEIINADIHPVQNLSVLQSLPESERSAWGRRWITRGFEVLEKELTESAGKYCFGDTVTLADVVLVPQVVNARRFKVDMDLFPVIRRIDENLDVLDAFKKAKWSRQPDCPPELREE